MNFKIIVINKRNGNNSLLNENIIILLQSIASICGGFIGLNLQSVLGWHGLFVFGGSLGAIGIRMFSF